MPDNFERRERPVLPPRPTPPIPNNPNRNINGAPVTPAPSSQSGAMGVHGQRPQNRVQTNNVQNASAHNKMRSGRQPGRRNADRLQQSARKKQHSRGMPQNVDINQVRKEIEEEDKKQEKAHKRLIVFIIIGSILFAGLLSAFLVINIQNDRKNNTKLSTPVLHVNQLYNGTALSVDKIENATKFEYVISDSNGRETKFDSVNGYVELSTYLNQAGVYNVKVRAYGKGPRATSDFTEVETIINQIPLESPRFFINGLDQDQTNKSVYKTNANISNDTITWGAVPNAAKYRVNYGVDLENDEILYFEVDAKTGVNTFQLSDIYTFGPGAYIISIVAVPARNSYYLNSIYTYDDCKTIKCYLEQKMVQNAEYDAQSKTLSFSLEDGKYFDGDFSITVRYGSNIPNQEFSVHSIDVVTEYDGNLASYIVDLSGFANDGAVSLTITTLTNSTYGSNSSPASATIIN